MSILDKLRGDEDPVDVPTTRPTEGRVHPRVAIWLPDGYEVSQLPEDWDRIPDAVAQELDLDPGDRLAVEQREIKHWQDTKIIRAAQGPRGSVDALSVLQAVVDKTVEDSNFGLPEVRVVPPPGWEDQDDPDPVFDDCENLVWWMYQWLGAKNLYERLVDAVGAEIQDFPHGSGGN